MNPDGTEQINLTKNAAYDRNPVWSSDSKRIAFVSQRNNKFNIFVMNNDGSQVNKVTSGNEDIGAAWSPDNKKIAFNSQGAASQEAGQVSDIFTVNPDGSELKKLSTVSSDKYPVWSPDGKKIAFISQRDGNSEIYMMNPDGTGQINLTKSKDEEYTPSWY